MTDSTRSRAMKRWAPRNPVEESPQPAKVKAAIKTAPCTSGYCDRDAVAAVYIHRGPSDDQPGTILIRPDHLGDNAPNHAVISWRCAECLHHDIDRELALSPPQENQ